MPISQFTKIVPLQLKEDNSSDILLESLKRKIQKDDEGQAKVQAYADSIGNIDILKETDKQYFDKKYSEAIEAVNSQKSYDFSNPSNIRAMSATLDNVLYDDKIKRDISSTKQFRTVNSELDEATTNPKLKHTWNSDTLEHDRFLQSEYLKSTDPNAVYNQQHMTIYDGYKENTETAISKVKETTDILMGEKGRYLELTGKSIISVKAAVYQGLANSQMPKIEFENIIRRDPKYIEKVHATVVDTLVKQKDNLNQQEGYLKAATVGSIYYQQQKAHVEDIKADIANLSNIASSPPSIENAYKLFIQQKAQSYISSSTEKSKKLKFDESYSFEINTNLKENDALRKDREFDFEVSKDARDANLKEREFAFEQYKATLSPKESSSVDNIDEMTGLSSVGGSIATGSNNLIIDAPMEAVKAVEYNPQNYSADISKHNTIINSSLKDIDRLLTDPETHATVNKALIAKGFTKGLESFKSGGISPNNIYKFQAVLDDIFTEGVAKNYLSEGISNNLKRISEAASNILLRGSVNNKVLATAKESLGISTKTTMSQLSPDQRTKVFNKANALLEAYGLSTIEGKHRIRANFKGEKGREGLTNQLQASFTSSAKNLVDQKGNKINSAIRFDVSKSTINSVDADGYAHVTLRAPSGEKDAAGELVGAEDQYKFKLDNNTFQYFKEHTVGKNSSFGKDPGLDDYLRIAKIDIATSTELNKVNFIADSKDGLPPMMKVPYNVVSANDTAFGIRISYNGGDKPFSKNTLEMGNYITYDFKTTEEFKRTLALRCKDALAEINKTEAYKNKPLIERTRVALDMAIFTIVKGTMKAKDTKKF